MRLLCIGCLHGKITRKLVKRLRKEEFDYVLCTGDLANADKSRKLIFKKENWKLLHSGFKLVDIIGKHRLNNIKKYEIKSMQSSINMLKSLRRKVVLVSGNNDYLRKDIKDIRLKGLEDRIKRSNIRYSKSGVIKINEYYLVGFSGYDLKDGFDRLNKIFKKLRNKKVILLTHSPPYGYFDIVKLKSSPKYGKHVGDKDFLKIIKRFKPLVHVSSHMHEHQGMKKLGKTVLVNSGAGYLGKYATIDLKNKTRVRFAR